jgi:uncharacterized protein
MIAPAPVACNAGPLIALAKLNLLHLLKELYGRVRFSQSVYDEAVTEGIRQGYEDVGTLLTVLDQMNWRPEEVNLDEVPDHLREAPLDRGEHDTVVLAIALGSNLILMDETEGRRAARAQGFTVRGSMGILVEAFRQSLISADQLELNLTEMARRQDIWVNPALAQRLLREVLGG